MSAVGMTASAPDFSVSAIVSGWVVACLLDGRLIYQIDESWSTKEFDLKDLTR